MNKLPHPIDDLFRSGLADHKVLPSDESRSAFIREAAGETNKRASLKWWIVGLGLVLITAGIFVIEEVREGVRNENSTGGRLEAQAKPFVPGTPAVSQIQTRPGVAENRAGTQIQTRPGVAENRAGTQAQAKPTQPIPHTPAAAPVVSKSSMKTPAAASAPTSAGAQAGPATSGTPEISNPPPAVLKSEANPPSAVLKSEANPLSEVININGQIPPPATGDSVIGNKPVLLPGQGDKPGARSGKEGNLRSENTGSTTKKWNISAGVYYTPEWMFNTLNGDKYVNNFGAEGTFHFGPYSVRTGLGLSITTGSNEMLVQTNPYLGSYKALDSLVFNWDVKHYNLIPTYYTTGTNVYDTALSYNYTYYKKRYTYLQVPLILGYDFLLKDWFTLGARAGAVMSVLLKTETLTGSYDPGKDRIVTINNVTPDRIQLNWQAVVGINAAFRLSRRFSIEAEPNVRYYFNSVYESSELTKKPWSVGFRAAFLITF